MGDIAVPTSQQHMTAGFMLVTMEDVVLASLAKFLFVHSRFSCLFLFQSMLTKMMFTAVVLCSDARVPFSVAKDDHTDNIALLVEKFVKQKLKHGSSNCLSQSCYDLLPMKSLFVACEDNEILDREICIRKDVRIENQRIQYLAMFSTCLRHANKYSDEEQSWNTSYWRLG